MILQVSWFVDYVPPWLGIVLILTGASLVYVRALTFAADPFGFFGLVTIVMIISGFSLGLYQAYIEAPVIMVTVFGGFGRYIEGLAVVRLYQKIEYMLREQSYPSGHGGLRTKLLFKLAAVFIVIATGWVIVFLMLFGDLDLSYEYALTLFWTLATVILSSVGLYVKIWSAHEALNSIFVIGTVLIITGSEIYNISTLGQEFVSFVAVNIAYAIGFWVAAYRLVTRKEAKDPGLSAQSA